MDAGVIRCLKSHYRKNLAKIRLAAFEEKKDFTINVLEVLLILIRDIPPIQLRHIRAIPFLLLKTQKM